MAADDIDTTVTAFSSGKLMEEAELESSGIDQEENVPIRSDGVGMAASGGSHTVRLYSEPVMMTWELFKSDFLSAINTLDDVISVEDKKPKPHLLPVIDEIRTGGAYRYREGRISRPRVCRDLSCFDPKTLTLLVAANQGACSEYRWAHQESSRHYPAELLAKLDSCILFFNLVTLYITKLTDPFFCARIGFNGSRSCAQDLMQELDNDIDGVHCIRIMHHRLITRICEIYTLGRDILMDSFVRFSRRVVARLVRPEQSQLILIVMERMLLPVKGEVIRVLDSFQQVTNSEATEELLTRMGNKKDEPNGYGSVGFFWCRLVKFLAEMRSERQEVLILKYLYEE
ncbi:hypothetical protein BJ508DRAFT_343063 [Ascobolus immersus RN42]|uniref:Uncharacterized protein n=1 Tax=Ascobolus immersus RN42 TaxID=1160509 RepID=A0A3N4HE55_ASCIM|nr:hypothetical protein BJ508DRAFT_343063 [Ascobolus immersus RN42]